MENLVDSSLLQVSLVEKAPTHPFNYEDWIKLLDDDVDVRRPKINMRKMKPETHDVDDYNNADLNWDHSPQNVNSEADFNWSDALTPRNPEDLARLFTDELIEEAMESSDTVATDSEANDDVFVPDKDEPQTTRRLIFPKSANFLEPEFPIRTPLLPETVDLERVQNLNPALALATPFLPDLVDPNQAQNLDLALAELDLEELQVTPERQDRTENPPATHNLRRSARLKKTNSKFVGKDWENALEGPGDEGRKGGRKEKLPRAWL